MNEKGAQGWAGLCRPLLIIAPAVARMASTTQMACIGMAVAWQATPTCYGMVVTVFTCIRVGQSFIDSLSIGNAPAASGCQCCPYRGTAW